GVVECGADERHSATDHVVGAQGAAPRVPLVARLELRDALLGVLVIARGVDAQPAHPGRIVGTRRLLLAPLSQAFEEPLILQLRVATVEHDAGRAAGRRWNAGADSGKVWTVSPYARPGRAITIETLALPVEPANEGLAE